MEAALGGGGMTRRLAVAASQTKLAEAGPALNLLDCVHLLQSTSVLLLPGLLTANSTQTI